MKKIIFGLFFVVFILPCCVAQNSTPENKEGWVKKYSEDGKLLGEAQFQNGKLHGISRAFDRNGQVYETVYENGFQIGNRIYDDAGKLIRDTSLERKNIYPDWMLEDIEVETLAPKRKNLLISKNEVIAVGTFSLNKASEEFWLIGHRESYKDVVAERDYFRIREFEKIFGDTYRIKLSRSPINFAGRDTIYEGHIKKTKDGFSIDVTGKKSIELKSTHIIKIHIRNITNQGRAWKKTSNIT